MFTMEISEVIRVLVESMLPRFSPANNVLVMSFRIEISEVLGNLNKGPLKSGKLIRRAVALMFHRPHNYTKAMWTTLTKEAWQIRDHKIWKVESDHDSCWRSDGVESPFGELWSAMTKETGYAWTCHPRLRLGAQIHFDFCGEPKVITLKSYRYERKARTFSVEY